MSVSDFVVVGGGSAGSIVAARLSERFSVTLIEAGPSERHPLVSLPFGLVWLIGSRGRDWRYRTVPQAALGGRQIAVPRGRMLGGSGSINSMVWFRGRQDDFDGWQVPGWRFADVEDSFEALEAEIQPRLFQAAHPMVGALADALPTNDGVVTPERPSGGAFRHNMGGGRRRSAASVVLRRAMRRDRLRVMTGEIVETIGFKGARATSVHMRSGARIEAARGIILSAGSIGSPSILMRSGIGPAGHLKEHGIDVRLDRDGVGDNLQDHPGVGLHFDGVGYGLTGAQAGAWMAAPFAALAGRGRFTSPTVEGGAFFRVGAGEGAPDIQTHLIPFRLDPLGRRYAPGAGFFADVCVCRPKSRGRLLLSGPRASDAPLIDPALLSDPSDRALLIAAIPRLRDLVAGIGGREVMPGDGADLDAYVTSRCGTAYHPVGTLRMGQDADAPVSADLAVRGVEGLWVADASVMPRLTSANTNAPSMMIGWRAADLIGAAA